MVNQIFYFTTGLASISLHDFRLKKKNLTEYFLISRKCESTRLVSQGFKHNVYIVVRALNTTVVTEIITLKTQQYSIISLRLLLLNYLKLYK